VLGWDRHCCLCNWLPRFAHPSWRGETGICLCQHGVSCPHFVTACRVAATPTKHALITWPQRVQLVKIGLVVGTLPHPQGRACYSLTTACLPSQCHCGLTGLASCQGLHCRKFIEHLIYSGIKQNHRAQGRSLSFPQLGSISNHVPAGRQYCLSHRPQCRFLRTVHAFTLFRHLTHVGSILLLALTLREVASFFRVYDVCISQRRQWATGPALQTKNRLDTWPHSTPENTNTPSTC
jgi:hypothetical protein